MMNAIRIFFCVVFAWFGGASGLAQGISISALGGAPDTSALLDVQSTSRGMLLPRMTTAQRDAIQNPANGLAIYNLDTDCIDFFDQSFWSCACAGKITSLNCTPVSSVSLFNGFSVNTTLSLTYTGGNGGAYQAFTVNSTGVSGLTLTYNAGMFRYGSGELVFTLSGTPTSTGTASFALNLAGQSCVMSLPVTTFSCTSTDVSFVYQGVAVTYKTVSRNYSSLAAPHNAQGTKCWLDRNLGATQVATSSTDANSYGDLFQWGRSVDGHQISTSPTSATTSASSSPGNSNFITNTTGSMDWFSTPSTSLWQGASGTNNPCPAGFRLPTVAEMDAERASWSAQNPTGAFGSQLKIPSSGSRRNSGLLNTVGTGLWTSGATAVETNYSQQTFNASGTWTCPPGITSVLVECWGGGGAGGGSSNSDRGGGGGGGAYAASVLTVVPGQSYTFTIGAGGVGGAGGDTWFGTNTTVLAKGGAVGSSANSTFYGAGGGAGGQASASIGTLRFSGGNGGGVAQYSTRGAGGGGSAGRLSNGLSGIDKGHDGVNSGTAGGTSLVDGGSGGAGGADNTGGQAGVAPGGGGGGSGRVSSGTVSGGSGAAGRVVISAAPRAKALYFTAAGAAIVDDYRANGYAVRCIKE
jgi:hypothetical protein